MKYLTSIFAAILITAASPAIAQSAQEGFDVSVGYAGFDTSVEHASSDEQALLSVGYRFDSRLSMDLSIPVESFQSNHEQVGYGTLIEVDTRPYTLALNYHLRPNQTFNPFVGLGYTHFQIDPRSAGILAGLPLNAKSTGGLTVRAGADYNVNESWFVRGSVATTKSDLTIYAWTGASNSKIVDEAMDPVSYSLSLGYRF